MYNIIKNYIFSHPCIADCSPFPVTHSYPEKEDGYRLNEGLFVCQVGNESEDKTNVLQEEYLFDDYEDAFFLAKKVGVPVITLYDKDGIEYTYLVRYHIVEGILAPLDDR